MTKKKINEFRKRLGISVGDSNLKNLPNPETFAERLQRLAKPDLQSEPMTNGDYLIQLASNPTEENLQRLKEVVEDAETYNRNLKRSQEFRKRLEAASHSSVEEPTLESEYQRQLQHVQRIYELSSQKDVTTMSPVALELYHREMDRIRYARGALELDRPLIEKLSALSVQLKRHYPNQGY